MAIDVESLPIDYGLSNARPGGPVYLQEVGGNDVYVQCMILADGVRGVRMMLHGIC